MAGDADAVAASRCRGDGGGGGGGAGGRGWRAVSQDALLPKGGVAKREWVRGGKHKALSGGKAMEAEALRRKEDEIAELKRKKEQKELEMQKRREDVEARKATKTWKRADDTAERLRATEAARAALVEKIRMQAAKERAQQLETAEKKRLEKEREESKRKERAANIVKGFAAVGGTDIAAERLARWERMAAEQKDAAAKEEAACEVRRVLNCTSARDVLGLGALEAAEISLVKRNYKLLARALHPDKCSHANAKEAFQKVHRAYEELKNSLGA